MTLVAYGLTALFCYFCTCYSAAHGIWPVKDLAELADGLIGCSEVDEGWVLLCLELLCDKVSCTYGSGGKILGQPRRCIT